MVKSVSPTDERTLNAICIYGPQHVTGIRDILMPALASQALPDNGSLVLHLLNYRDDRAWLAGISAKGLSVHDWSATRSASHIGFGEAVNYLISQVAPTESFFLINPDSFPFANCLQELLAQGRYQPSAGIIEARQWPSEHPKEYDAVTLETPWASGAFCLVSMAAFQAVGGFDPTYFLYNEDVDLSWRMWAAGYRILYAPDAVAAHFTGSFTYRTDRYYYEHFFSSRNFIALSYKFFGEVGESDAIAHLRKTTFPKTFQERILANYQQMKPSIRRYSGTALPPQCRITGFNLYHECRSV